MKPQALKSQALTSKVQPARPAASNQLRIIGGKWRGRKLRFPSIDGLRPTGDRIRETLFNWLAPEIQGARCLDVYAGSGALGLEALSRGAGHVSLLEKDAQAIRSLREHVQLLGAESGVELGHTDSLAFLQRGNQAEPFDVVFVDPPFSANLWQQTLDALEAGGWLADSASIYLELGVKDEVQLPVNWVLHRDKRAGQVSYRLYYREAP